jgi:glutamyl-tRNA synthetase
LPRKNNGVFFLTIEDTDQNRFVPGAEEYIMEALEWLGIAPDETIGKTKNLDLTVKAKERFISKYAAELINSGNAYYAFDAEALDEKKKKNKETTIYNHTNREKLDTLTEFLKRKLLKELLENIMLSVLKLQ